MLWQAVKADPEEKKLEGGAVTARKPELSFSALSKRALQHSAEVYRFVVEHGILNPVRLSRVLQSNLDNFVVQKASALSQ